MTGTLLLCSVLAFGQEDAMTLDDLAQSARQWARENLDEDALRLLEGMDRDKVRQLFSGIEKGLHGDYIVDLAALNDPAKALLPLLESYEATQPYAAWLKAQLDYLEVADEV